MRKRLNKPTHRVHAITLALLAVMLAACGGSGQGNIPASGSAGSAAGGQVQTVSVSGAFALFPLMTVWAEAYQEVNPGLRFDVQAGGAGKGMTDMLSGAADIAMLSREARQEELDQGAFLVPVTIDSVLATVSADNPYLAQLQSTGLTSAAGAGIWLNGSITTWGALVGAGTDAGAETINVYTRSDASGAAEMWARFLGGTAQEELRGTAVNGDPGLAEAVRQDKQGIGYNNVGFAYDPVTGEPIAGLAVIPLDSNGNGVIGEDEDFYSTRQEFTAAVGEGRYPFPPARVLYLVTKGTPSPAIAEFYRWVLTEGQQYVQDAGYVPLKADDIEAALAILEP